MELTVGVTIRQIVLHVQCASEFEAPGKSGMSPSEARFWVPNDKLCARLRLVGDQVFLRCQVTVAVGVGVWIWTAIRQVGEQVPLSSYGHSPGFSCSKVYT